MKCLLCNQNIRHIPQFYELILLKNPEKYICEFCEQQFEKISENHCISCCKSDINGICDDCKQWKAKGIFINHQAIFKYNSAMQEFFSQYKFTGDYRLHKIFQHHFMKFDKTWTVVPIPLSQKRYQERGFNQVSAFLTYTKFTNLLMKADSVKQSSLSRSERLNSKNTFAVKENVQIPPKIMLIDDIYTTGATLIHASEALKNAGAKDIRTFSLCR